MKQYLDVSGAAGLRMGIRGGKEEKRLGDDVCVHGGWVVEWGWGGGRSKMRAPG